MPFSFFQGVATRHVGSSKNQPRRYEEREGFEVDFVSFTSLVSSWLIIILSWHRSSHHERLLRKTYRRLSKGADDSSSSQLAEVERLPNPAVRPPAHPPV